MRCGQPVQMCTDALIVVMAPACDDCHVGIINRIDQAMGAAYAP